MLEDLFEFNLWDWILGQLCTLLSDVINKWLSSLQKVTSDIIRSSFFIERYSGLDSSILSSAILEETFKCMYLTSLSLLVLKLLWKGYKVYVLWRDGDAEVSPFQLFLNAVFALAVSIAFPILYEIAVNIAMDITGMVLNTFPSVKSTLSSNDLIGFTKDRLRSYLDGSLLVKDLMLVIFVLIYLIMFIVLVFQMLYRGVQMMIYRLGVPLAVVGLVDSDGGIWKNYIQIFFQQLMTVMIQNFCMRLALSVITKASVTAFVYGIVFMITAFKMPKIFSSFLHTGGGGGTAHAVLSATATLIKKH